MRPVVNVSLHGANIADIPAEIHKHHFWAFFELCDQHVDYCSIYTDGFKVDERVASAIVYKGTTKSVRLPDLTSIFWAKLHTFFLTIDVIRRSKLEKFVIFSDSLSTLQAIHGFNIDNDLVQKFIKEYSVQTKHGKTIALWWIPSHVGISGNEKAESAAKNVLLLSVPALKSTASELLPTTKPISEKWQKSWNNCTGNKLQSINPTIGVYQHLRSLSRRDVVITHRLRIGHTRLTHSYLLSGSDQPECSTCHCPLTVKHIVIECTALTSTRNKQWRTFLIMLPPENFVNFNKESHFYSTV